MELERSKEHSNYRIATNMKRIEYAAELFMKLTKLSLQKYFYSICKSKSNLQHIFKSQV